MGRWRLRRWSVLFTLFGGTDVDARQAEIEGDVIHIVAITLWGGADLYVPAGVEVDLGGIAIFGHNGEGGVDPPPRPGTPLVSVRAFTLFGGFNVWRVPPDVRGGPREIVEALRSRPELPRK
jgi:hypothetical protein